MSFKSKFGAIVFSIVFMILIIAFPDISNNAITKGLLLSTNVIIPSLFPFMICVLMFTKSEITIKCNFVNKVLFKVFGQSFEMFFVFLLSMLGGYPIGARLINELYLKKAINKKTANIMLMYCINAGPSFVVIIAGGTYNSKTLGIILLVSHILSSVIMALFCSKKLKKQKIQFNKCVKKNKNFSEIFLESVFDGSVSILKICSIVVFFSVINAYFDYFFSNLPIIKYVYLFTEVTSAVTKCKNIYITAFILGFSGISIWFQVFALSSGRNINILSFSIGRILHGTISVIITKIILSCFKIKIPTFSNNINFNNKLLYGNFSLFISMSIMLLVFLIFIYSKNNSGKIINDVL